MSEIEELFSALREESRIKKLSNLEQSTNILKEKNINFVSKNNGIHLIVGNFDFYPSTGKFINRITKKDGRGIFNLIKKLDNDKTA
tara:strand:- start:2002 stop:2259 length:258 start_codon:yes stop_codon:yes gene_type:complete